MERRHVLKSVAGVATASTVGLAGCSGGSGGGDGNGTATGTGSGGGSGSGCSTPDDLESTLPEGDDYSMIGEPSTVEGSGVSEGTVSATYEGPDGETYAYTVNAFTEAQYAEDPNTDTGATGDDAVAAYVVVDTHQYIATGPSQDQVKTFLATSSALNSSCIDSNVEWGN